MKLKFDFNETNIKEKVEENKDLIISASIFGVSVLLFIIFILPNILSFPGKWSERSVETEKLDQIKKAKLVLENSNNEMLDSELEIVNRTLPSNKNFELILNAISQAALQSNVIIEGYKFKGGSQVAQVSPEQSQTLVFEISTEGGVVEAGNFVKELNRIYPISEARKIEYGYEETKLTVAFYYKPFIEVNAQDVALAREKTVEEISALEEVSGWEFLNVESSIDQLPGVQLPIEDVQEENATESASTL